MIIMCIPKLILVLRTEVPIEQSELSPLSESSLCTRHHCTAVLSAHGVILFYGVTKVTSYVRSEFSGS